MNLERSPSLEITTLKNVIQHSLLILPISGFLLLGYTIIPNELSSYIYYTLFIIFIVLFFFFANAHDAFVIIKVYNKSILFQYPYRVFKRNIYFDFSQIESIDLKPPPAPRSKPSIEIFTKTKKRTHILHLLNDKQMKMLSDELEKHSDIMIVNKK